MRIWVRFDVEGFHCWPDAPMHRAYLRDRHRHLFKVKVELEVEHGDREIEFHDLLETAQWCFGTGDGTWSCEKMAGELGARLVAEYGRDVTVEVSEDGECGAIVETKKEAAAQVRAAAVGQKEPATSW